MSDRLIIGDGTEGLCPVHGERMLTADAGGRLIAGHCTPCRKYWWYDTVRGGIGSAPDHDPRVRGWFT